MPWFQNIHKSNNSSDVTHEFSCTFQEALDNKWRNIFGSEISFFRRTKIASEALAATQKKAYFAQETGMLMAETEMWENAPKQGWEVEGECTGQWAL